MIDANAQVHDHPADPVGVVHIQAGPRTDRALVIRELCDARRLTAGRAVGSEDVVGTSQLITAREAVLHAGVQIVAAAHEAIDDVRELRGEAIAPASILRPAGDSACDEPGVLVLEARHYARHACLLRVVGAVQKEARVAAFDEGLVR